MDGRAEIMGEVLDFIRRGIRETSGDGEFERLARAVFEYQFAENEPYRRFCERRGVTPESGPDWYDIPAVPTAAFKEAALICGGREAAEVVFRTSGTSQGRERRGAHYVRDLIPYEASALSNFQAHLLPDAARITMFILAPDFGLAPDSSLSWMLERVRREFGSPESGHYVDEHGLRPVALLAALDRVQTADRPVALLGTAAAFAHLLETLKEHGQRWRLPVGSRVMETGGFKGQKRVFQRSKLYDGLTYRLGVPEFYCVAEYGMTEMCSQFYDNVLVERSLGRSPPTRHKVAPPWVRTQVVDAETLEPLPPGRLGVLRHVDLANIDSVMAVQTDDLGVAGARGFDIVGRASGAEVRGCSIAMDEWLTAQL